MRRRIFHQSVHACRVARPWVKTHVVLVPPLECTLTLPSAHIYSARKLLGCHTKLNLLTHASRAAGIFRVDSTSKILDHSKSTSSCVSSKVSMLSFRCKVLCGTIFYMVSCNRVLQILFLPLSHAFSEPLGTAIPWYLYYYKLCLHVCRGVYPRLNRLGPLRQSPCMHAH